MTLGSSSGCTLGLGTSTCRVHGVYIHYLTKLSSPYMSPENTINAQRYALR
jgi:hypothetical protein